MNARRVLGRCVVGLAVAVLGAGCATSKLIQAGDSPSLLSPVEVNFERVAVKPAHAGVVATLRWSKAVGAVASAPADAASRGDVMALPFLVELPPVLDDKIWRACPPLARGTSPAPELRLLKMPETAVVPDATAIDIDLLHYDGQWQDVLSCAVTPPGALAAPQSMAAYLDSDGNLILIYAKSGQAGRWFVAGFPHAVMHKGTGWRVFHYLAKPVALPFTVIFDVITLPVQAAVFAVSMVCWSGC